jgi:hypothetical protein
MFRLRLCPPTGQVTLSFADGTNFWEDILNALMIGKLKTFGTNYYIDPKEGAVVKICKPQLFTEVKKNCFLNPQKFTFCK